MGSIRYRASLVALIASATFGISYQDHSLHRFFVKGSLAGDHASAMRKSTVLSGSVASQFSLPFTFEPTANGSAQFVARGKGLEAALTRRGIELSVPQGPKRAPRIASLQFAHDGLVWRGAEKLRVESNYLIGSESRKWRTHVPHFASAETRIGGSKIVAYGSATGLEYDLRLPLGADAAKLRLQLAGARDVQLDKSGNLLMRVGASHLVMKKPAIFESEQLQTETQSTARTTKEYKQSGRRQIDGEYVINADRTIGLRIARHDPRAALVIDPSISLVYSSFLGGAGAETVANLAVDSNGNIYFGGTTTSPTTFPETTTGQLGPGTAGATGDPAEFFVAKIDPTQSGANSLVYLTFLGGSAAQSGGLIAVDTKGDVAITGTTSSTDFPVTDSSKPTSGLTSGGNDTAVSEIDPTGSKLLYSTLFGGNGSQSTQRAGGIALDSAGNIFIASDTNSSNLPVTSTAYVQTYTSTITDGFLAKFQIGTTPSLAYCTYLGLNGQIGIGGIAIDASENAYIAGFTSDPNADFPATNGIQSAYGGGAFDGFLMKISTTSGSGTTALSYATLLGGSGSDQAFAIALDNQSPPSAYVTGTTSSTNFPTNGAVAAYQPNLPPNATARTSTAFLSVIAQSTSGTSGAVTTSLAYSTYLGGSQADWGESLAISAPSAVYVAGTANSWDFPWLNNFQPFNGFGDAFVAKLDPTSAGVASLIYATPLGGTSPPGVNAVAQGSGVAIATVGSIWIAGQTTSADFPAAGNAGNGFQQICSSCQQSPPASDAFIAEIQETNSRQLPSLLFAGPSIPIDFGKQLVGSVNIPPQFAAVKNTGEAPLVISTIGITGSNSTDFSLSGTTSCAGATIQPGNICSFEVSFVPSVAGFEGAFVQVASNASGSPQVLEVFGQGTGVIVLPASLNFGSQLANTISNPQTATLTNTSNDLVFIDSIQENGANPAVFPSAIVTGQCEAGTTLASGSNCQNSFQFAPKSTGSFQAQVDIQYHVEGTSEQNLLIPLSGIGLPAAPVASLAPNSGVNFGAVAVGATEQAQVITLTNTGSAALNVTAIAITGANATDFGIVAVGTSPCPASSGSLAIGASCTIGVQFSPKTAGSESAALTFTDNAAGSPQSIPLAGSAQSTAVQIAPSTLTFGGQSVGTKSAAQQITVTNSGSSALGVNGISITGTNAGDFTQTNNCPPSLAANGFCVINVVFQPTATGTRTASISISDNAPNSPQAVSVTGTGTQASVTLAPTGPISFGNQAAGTASAATTITVTNSGTGALAVSKIAFSGTNEADFSETDNCNWSVPPAGNCAIQVTFKPQCGNNQAARSAKLALMDNALASPQSVALTGTATGDICFAAASDGSTSATVAAGNSAAYSLDVSAASGYTGNVALACSGAPQNSTCTVSPASASVAGSTLVPLTVNVTTTAATTAMIQRMPSIAPRARSRGHRMELVLCILACLALAVMSLVRPRRNAKLQLLGIALLFCIVIIGVVGCGASGGDPPVVTNPGTPQGTYKLTVTGTANDGTSQSISLSLTVN